MSLPANIIDRIALSYVDAGDGTTSVQTVGGGGGGGDATAANQVTGNNSLASIDTRTGSVTETAPASDTASSGLNGRLQRIAQRLTSLIAQIPATLGSTTSANSLSVVPASDAVTTAGGITRIAASTITRPSDTTAYAVGDLVANSTTSGSVTPFTLAAARITDGSFIIRRVRLRKSSTTLTNAQFRVHLFNASPTVSVGDNEAFNSAGALSTTGTAAYLGYTDITIDVGFSDGSNGFSGSTFLDTQVKLSGGNANMYALLEARAAYTPTSAETITVTVEILQD
jgi:hypothetical protein